MAVDPVNAKLLLNRRPTDDAARDFFALIVGVERIKAFICRAIEDNLLDDLPNRRETDDVDRAFFFLCCDCVERPDDLERNLFFKVGMV